MLTIMAKNGSAGQKPFGYWLTLNGLLVVYKVTDGQSIALRTGYGLLMALNGLLMVYKVTK